MKISRRFTKAGQDVFSTVEYEKRTSRITNPDGSVVFEMNDAEIPRPWSQLATDIMVSKYFRKAGVPQADSAGEPIRDDEGNIVTGGGHVLKPSRPFMPPPLLPSLRYWCKKNGAAGMSRGGLPLKRPLRNLADQSAALKLSANPAALFLWTITGITPRRLPQPSKA